MYILTIVLLGSEDDLKLFHCYDNLITVDLDNSAIMITVHFVPLRFHTRHCFLVLSNPQCGDVVISIAAKVNKPLPSLPKPLHCNSSTFINTETRTIHFNTFADALNFAEDIVLPHSNLLLEAALMEISKWELSENELKIRLLTESLQFATLSSKFSKTHVADCVNISSGQLVFSIEGDNDHFILPEILDVPAYPKGGFTMILLVFIMTSRFVCIIIGYLAFPVEFHGTVAGQYECHIMMKSGYDIRTVVVECTVLNEGQIAQIEFKTKAIQPLTQNIPMVILWLHH